MSNKIIPPSEDEIKEDYKVLYRNFHMKSVASHAGASASTYSRQRNPEEPLTRNPLWEVKMEMYASVVTNQEEIGKWIAKEIYDYAIELGLVNEKPLDIIQLAIEQLKNITLDQLNEMMPEQRFEVLGNAAELEVQAKRVKEDAIAAKNTGQTHAREFSRAGAGGSGGFR